MAELKMRSDAPTQLEVFFLLPNMEGLLRDIRNCDSALLPSKVFEAALRKDVNCRDIALNELKKAARKNIRDYVLRAQPGLHDLAKTIAARLRP